MLYRTLPPASLLWELFSYSPLTGELTRIKKVGTRGYVGQVVGTPRKYGYLYVGVEGTSWAVHRLIWKWCYGTEPSETLDHIDRNPTNNRITNLREATWTLQRHNQKSRKDNLPKGVYFTERQKTRPYRSMTRIGGVRKHLGYFHTPEEAEQAYKTFLGSQGLC